MSSIAREDLRLGSRGRDQVPAQGRPRPGAVADALRARGAARFGAPASAHLHDPRARRARRPALHRHGAARGPDDEAADRGRPAADRAGASTSASRSRWRSTPRTARGIVHRDIKPANLFVTARRSPQGARFRPGQADRSSAAAARRSAPPSAVQTTADADVTVTGAAVGTAAYMSPEQAHGEPVDARTDLFSLGSVLYEMATGRRAFAGDNIGTVIAMRILNGDLVPPRSLNPAIPERLEAIILRLMEVDPNRRYQIGRGDARRSAAAVARAGSDGVGDARAVAGADPAGAAALAPLRRRRWVAGAAVVLRLRSRWALAGARRGPRRRAHRSRQHPHRRLRRTTPAIRCSTRRCSTALKVQLGQSPFLDIVPDDEISRRRCAPMERPADERLTHDGRARGLPAARASRRCSTASIARARHELRADARTPPTASTGESLAREQARRPSQGARARASSAPMASSMRTQLGESLPSMQAVRRADRAGDDAVAGGAEGLRARASKSGGGARARVGRVLQSGDRARPASSRPPTPRSRPSTAASASGGAARSTRGSPTSARSASANASGCSSPTSTTTASPATRTRPRTHAGVVEAVVPARLSAGQRAGADLQPLRPLTTGRWPRRRKRCAAAPDRPSRSRTWPSRIADWAASPRRRRPASRRSSSASRRRRRGGCSISSA